MNYLITITWLATYLTAVVAIGGLKVPGESPFKFCNADRDDDLLVVEKIDMAPNPPQLGKAVLVTFSGNIKKTITKGAYIKLTVKYGLIQLISTTADLCEQAGDFDLSCPLESGKVTVTKKIDLPSAIPPGTYNVFGDAYSDDDESITCLRATVNFPPPGIYEDEL